MLDELLTNGEYMDPYQEQKFGKQKLHQTATPQQHSCPCSAGLLMSSNIKMENTTGGSQLLGKGDVPLVLAFWKTRCYSNLTCFPSFQRPFYAQMPPVQ